LNLNSGHVILACKIRLPETCLHQTFNSIFCQYFLHLSRLMKKYFSYFFILLIFIQSGGIFWWLKVEQIAIHQEMQDLLAESSFNQYIELNLPVKEYYDNLKDDGKELLLNGKLYDIKSVSIVNGRAKIKAIHDEKEENILLHIVHFVKHSNSKQKQIPASLAQLMLLCYLPQLSKFNFSQPFKTIEKVLSQAFAAKLFDCKIDSPPPQMHS
jgi:hypothetical protein